MATQRLRRRLVRHLIADDALHDPRWIDAFRAVPRHVFLPRFFTRAGDRWAAFDKSDPGWLDRVYSRDVLVTQLDDDPSLWERARTSGPVPGVPTSSSSMPAIMAIMLEELRVADGHQVLEIGTGTGYNAALLSHRCGSGHVSTMDIDATLVASARTHLRAAGYAPAVATGDGTDGFPSGILFDRIICTASVSSIPPAWLEQTLPGGHIVTTLNRPLGAGLIRLTPGPGPTASGHVLPRDGRFMPLRAHRLPPPPPLPPPTSWRPTRLPLDLVLKPELGFEFFASLELPGVQPVHDPDYAPSTATDPSSPGAGPARPSATTDFGSPASGAGSRPSASFGARSGSDPGSSSGPRSESDPGSSFDPLSGSGPGSSFGTRSGSDPGPVSGSRAGSGSSSGSGAGSDSGSGSGFGPGSDSGPDSGFGPGSGPGSDAGSAWNSGSGTEFQPDPDSSSQSDPEPLPANHPRAGSFALTHPDGSWARYRTHDNTLEVSQGGPRPLWDLAERAFLLWESLGRPTRSHFGLTLDGPHQHFWLGTPDGPHWNLTP